ncbi:hypothetical protein [Caballeronia arvi]|nr:hypothetical protein [Caballeronia arvi]
MAVTREMKTLLSGWKLFQCDELVLQKGVDLRLIQSKRVGQIPEQQ